MLREKQTTERVNGQNFVDLLKNWDNEIEKAVFAVGEYWFDDEYAHLQVPLSQ